MQANSQRTIVALHNFSGANTAPPHEGRGRTAAKAPQMTRIIDITELALRDAHQSLLATRMATVAEIKTEVLSQPGRYTEITDNLHAKEVLIGDGERRRRYILCYNPKEAERQRAQKAGEQHRRQHDEAPGDQAGDSGAAVQVRQPLDPAGDAPEADQRVPALRLAQQAIERGAGHGEQRQQERGG